MRQVRDESFFSIKLKLFKDESITHPPKFKRCFQFKSHWSRGFRYYYTKRRDLFLHFFLNKIKTPFDHIHLGNIFFKYSYDIIKLQHIKAV